MKTFKNITFFLELHENSYILGKFKCPDATVLEGFLTDF